MPRRRFRDPQQQAAYERGLTNPPNMEGYGPQYGLGRYGGDGFNAPLRYGYFHPDRPPPASTGVRSSIAYAAWAAGVELGRKARKP